MEKKNTILLTVIAIATLLVAVVGATFAYFTATVTTAGNEDAKTQTVIKSATLGVTYYAGNAVVLGDTDSDGEVDEYVMPGSKATNTFSIENKGDYAITVDINWDDFTNEFDDGVLVDANKELRYTLSYVKNGDATENGTLKNDAAMPTESAVTTSGKIDSITIPAKTKYDFTLEVVFSEKGSSQNQNNQGKEFSAKIDVTIDDANNQFTTPTTP